MNTELIRSWIEKNQPAGPEKLAAASEISSSLVHKILAGHEPTVAVARRVARAMGITISELCGEHTSGGTPPEAA